MATAAAVFVSKRLQRAAFAVLCIITTQLLISLSSCEPEVAPMAARVALR